MEDHRHLPAAAEVACSLEADQLADRVDAWRQLTARMLTRSARPGHLTSEYPREHDLVQRLRELIDAERDCCPFLGFTVEEDAEVVRVDLEYPPGFEEWLGQVFEPGSAR